MREKNVAGLIMSPALGTPDGFPAEIRSWGIPLVLVMRPMGLNVDTVGVDNEYGFSLATAHLIQQHHTRIAFAGNRKGHGVANQRRQGYLSTMEQHSLPVDDGWLVDVELTPESGRQAVRDIFAMKPRPTAVVCYNDQVAFGVLHELDRMGKRAGKALAVVDCDNVVAAEHTNPPLTTLSAGADQLGTVASETLLARLNEDTNDHAPIMQYFAVPDLVVRESGTGIPPRHSKASF